MLQKQKKIGGDAQQKSQGKQDSMDTPNDGMSKTAKPLAAGFEAEGDEVIAEMDKDGNGKCLKPKMEMIKCNDDKMESHESKRCKS